MKKLIVALVLATVAVSANANGYRGGNHGGYRGHGGYHSNGWVAPLVIGGAIGYWANQPRVIYAPPPVYVEQPRHCTRYVTQDQFGYIIRQETICR